MRQTQQLASILGRYDLASDYVVVAGDMNDTPGSAPMAPLLSVPNLFDVLDLQFGGAMNSRWTYRYNAQGNQIDYVLVSKPLRAAFQQAGVERRGIWDIKNITGEQGFASVTKKSHAASDHGAVWAEFAW